MYTTATKTRSLPIYSEAHNSLYGSVFNINSMSISSPVYTSIYDVSTSSCNGYKIIGLVGEIKEFYGNTRGSLISDKSLLSNCLEDYEISLYVIPVVKLPESNEITEIERYAKAIGQHTASSISMNHVLKAKKAIEEILNLKVPEGMAFSAVLAVDEWADEKQIIKDATSYLENK